MNTNDKEKAKDIALNSVFQSDYAYDERSVRYGAEEMAKYKNEEFKELIRQHGDEIAAYSVEEFIGEYLN